MSPGSPQWILSYQLSPIIFCNGIAANLPNGKLPIISITEAGSVSGILSSGGPYSLDDYFANFVPVPGGTLFEAEMGSYPFANQAVAGNAIIRKSLSLSMIMVCPARADGFAAAQAKMMALKAAIEQHSALGGTYTVVTPKFPYTNMIHVRLVDVASGESHQAQNTYQWDFIRPLLTLEEAQAAQNSLMSKLSSGSVIQGQPAWSGPQTTTGQSSVSGTPIPAGSGTLGANTAPLPTPPIPPSGGETLTT